MFIVFRFSFVEREVFSSSGLYETPDAGNFATSVLLVVYWCVIAHLYANA